MHTKKPKYFSSSRFDDHNNKFGKQWSPVSELITGKNVSTLSILLLPKVLLYRGINYPS